MAARRFRKNERRGRASAHFPPRRPRPAQRKRPPESRPFWGRERLGGPSHEVGAWFDIRSSASQDSDYQKRACHGTRNESDGWNWVRAWITMTDTLLRRSKRVTGNNGLAWEGILRRSNSFYLDNCHDLPNCDG